MPIRAALAAMYLQQERKAPAAPAHVRAVRSNQICQIKFQTPLQGKICVRCGNTACHIVLPCAAALELLVSGHSRSREGGWGHCHPYQCRAAGGEGAHVRITNTLKEGFVLAECCEVLDL